MLIILCGPSGVGKTTIAQSLDCIVPTALTTRPKRVVNEDLIITDKFPPEHEHALRVTYSGNDYVITKAEMQRCMSSGRQVLVIAAGEGIMQLKAQYKTTVIYVYSKDFEPRRFVDDNFEAWQRSMSDFAVDRAHAVPFIESLMRWSSIN